MSPFSGTAAAACQCLLIVTVCILSVFPVIYQVWSRCPGGSLRFTFQEQCSAHSRVGSGGSSHPRHYTADMACLRTDPWLPCGRTAPSHVLSSAAQVLWVPPSEGSNSSPPRPPRLIDG